MTTRVNLVRNLKDSNDNDLTVKRASELLDINRSSIYYKGRLVTEIELEIMNHMNRIHTDNPAWGSRQPTSQLNGLGYKIRRYKVRRFMYDMGIEAISPKPNLSKPMPGHKTYPYLLRNKAITGPNQAWSIDYYVY